MIYRELGKTGRRVSAVGLGCEFLDGKPLGQVKATIDTALEHGVNILDVFMPGQEVREHIAAALGSRRKDVLIQGHIGSVTVDGKYGIRRDLPTVKRQFEALLRLFGYIDFGMMFFIDSARNFSEVFDTEFVTYVEQLKRQGDIRHIGFSSHNPKTAMRVIDTGVPEMMLFSINPAFDMLPGDTYVFDHFDSGFGAQLFRGLDPIRAQLYKTCAQRQIGITVMKPLGGGKLLSEEHTPFSAPLTVPQCIHYALSKPAVASVLPGCQTPEEVLEAMRYFTASDAERDYTQALSGVRNDFMGSCVYCGHCQPCPAGIDIAAVNKYLDIARLDEQHVPPGVRSHYASLAHGGGDCTACGLCEGRCPFAVPVIDNMRRAETLLADR